MSEGGWEEGGRTDRSADGHRSWVHDNRKPQRSDYYVDWLCFFYFALCHLTWHIMYSLILLTGL